MTIGARTSAASCYTGFAMDYVFTDTTCYWGEEVGETNARVF